MMHREIIWSVASTQRLHPCKFLFLRKAFGHLRSNEISGTWEWGGRGKKAGGDRTETALYASISLQASGKKQNKKKKQSVLTLCYTALESQLLFLLKKSLWTSNKKNSYCGFKVSLWQTVVGRLRSKPGAPVATAVGKELLGHGELPLGLNGVFCRTTAWLQGTESQVGRGLSPLLPDCLLFLRMGQKL